jgi:hypothetical protein
MTRFKLADVVLDVAAIDRPALCALNTGNLCKIIHTDYCRLVLSCHPIVSWCQHVHTYVVTLKCPECAAPSYVIPKTPEIFTEWEDPRELVTLKEQLAVVMAELDKRQAVLAKEMQPQTLAEADEIQRALDAAQVALKDVRKNLK